MGLQQSPDSAQPGESVSVNLNLLRNHTAITANDRNGTINGDPAWTTSGAEAIMVGSASTPPYNSGGHRQKRSCRVGEAQRNPPFAQW